MRPAPIPSKRACFVWFSDCLSLDIARSPMLTALRKARCDRRFRFCKKHRATVGFNILGKRIVSMRPGLPGTRHRKRFGSRVFVIWPRLRAE